MVNNQFNMIEKNGFCFTEKIFSKDKTDNAREAFWNVIKGNYRTGKEPENRFWDIGDDPKSIIKIDKPHLCDPALYALVTDSKFGSKLAMITGARTIQVWHTQGIWKPSGGGIKGNAGWHRDIQYWPFWKPEGVFTAWIALTDVGPDSGPVRYIERSNKWDAIDGLDFFDKEIFQQEAKLRIEHEDHKVVKAEVKQGQVSVHTSEVYHSSMENVSGDPRVGMVVHFCTDRSEKVEISGELQDYLHSMDDKSICPIIYNQ